MAILEIEKEVYKVPDKVAEKILEIANKVEELELKNKGLKEELKTTNKAFNILSRCNRKYCKLNDEIKEYCDSILERNIDVSDSDFDLGQYGVARDIKSKLDKCNKISFEELLKGIE